jgi:ribulose-5-phosphate 4-epimerase/fuculose-1-phosphate aldolase
MSENVNEIKKNIIAIGRLLWEKNLTSGLSGNLSKRLDASTFLITATQTCLGILQEDNIVTVDVNGQHDETLSKPSTEWKLHAAVYKAFPDCETIMHVHALCTNAFFLKNDRLEPKIFEAQHVLGDIPVVDQETLNVEDCDAVVEALNDNQIVVLRNHGCLIIGKDFFDCFVRLQTLEDAVKTDIITELYS